MDSVFFGFVNQINYRILNNVQHCYRSDKCDPVILSTDPAKGWRRGSFSGVDFSSSPLRMPGYPGYNETANFCRYGNSHCPMQNLDRRAVEYDANYRVMLEEILLPFRQWGIDAFDELSEVYIENGVVLNITPSELKNHPNAMCAAAQIDDGKPFLLGHYQPLVEDTSGQKWRVYFFYEFPRSDPHHVSASRTSDTEEEVNRVYAHMIQFDADNNPCYMNTSGLPQAEKNTLDAMYGDATKVPWLVQLYSSYQKPIGNMLHTTNPRPMAGGRNPEYRDLTKRGRLLIAEMGGMGATETSGDSNQFGGPIWNRTPVTGKSRMGYWTDKDGEFLLVERPIAGTIPVPPQPSPGNNVGEPYVSIEDRIRNKPSMVKGATPIKGSPSIPMFDDQADKPISDYARVGHTYSTDTAGLLAWFREIAGTNSEGKPVSRWWLALPTDPNDPSGEKKIECSPPSGTQEMLPLERRHFQCNLCKLKFTEEEYNFYVAHAAVLAPVPEGSPTGTAAGCPRQCGGYLENKGSMTSLLDSRAAGQIDLWAPPGTTIRRDAYFWKQPTMVNRAHVDQMMQKLGAYNTEGGGFSFDNLDSDVDRMGRLPSPTPNSYNPGLSHQITAPWAVVGETVAQVVTRLKSVVDIKEKDLIRYHAVGTEGWSVVTGTSTQVVSLGDVLYVARKDMAGEEFQLTATIEATTAPADTLLAEAIVASDAPKPVAGNYPNTDAGQKQYANDLRQWMLGVVQNSLYTWASAANVGVRANMLADQLAGSGMDPEWAESIDPSTGDTIKVDERIIGPYANKHKGSLKMITLPQLKRLRNQILPMLGYNLSDEGYSAGGDYSRRQQDANDNRFTTRLKDLPYRKFGTIPPQVLAATSTGLDYYVEWDLGDVAGTTARAHYPVGTTWWRINQQVGQIRRKGGKNPLHLDDASGSHGIPYTGDTVTSVCAYFLHGRIPMDKEVVKAYLVYQTNGGPSSSVLGCVGKYTGNVGFQRPDGSFGTLAYKGNSECYWQHFHPWSMETIHEAHWGGFGHDPAVNMDSGMPSGTVSSSPIVNGKGGDVSTIGVGSSGGYWGYASKWHVEHFTNWGLSNELGKPNVGGEESGMLVPQAVNLDSEDSDAYPSWMADNPQAYYFDHATLLSVNFCDTSYGWDFTQPFLDAWTWGTDLVQKTPEAAVWKNMTYGKYDELQSRYHAVCQASVNTVESVQTFDYFAPAFRDSVFPAENQSITGWVNYTNYDTSHRFSRTVKEVPNKIDSIWAQGPQIISQANDGGNGPNQAGDVARVLDITDTVKKLYSQRVTRYYQCKLGWGYNQLATEIPKLTDTNLAQAARFHTKFQDPTYFLNYRYVWVEGSHRMGVWLNDPWHHPHLIGDQVVAPSLDGDPLQPTDDDRRGRITAVSSFETRGLASTDPSYYKYHPWQLCQASQDLTYDGTILTPAPAEVADFYWYTRNDRPTVEYFEVDLRSTPLETSRREWRFQQPQIDATSANCPNVANCYVAQKGWTVGQFYERATSTWGSQVVPSTSSDHCANCGTLLKDVTYLDGDGIRTCTYDTPFDDNPLISAIQVATDTGAADPPKHGFVVEYLNTVAQVWKVLFEVTYDGTQYSYQQWESGAWVTHKSNTLPLTFAGVEGVGGVPKNSSAASGSHFLAVAAAKLRCKITRPHMRTRSWPGAGTYNTCVPDVASHTITIAQNICADGSQPDDFVHRQITLKDTFNNTRAMLIVGVETLTTSSYKLTLSAEIKAEDTQCSISWDEHRVAVSKFRVFGWPYRKGDVLMTPPPYTANHALVRGLQLPPQYLGHQGHGRGGLMWRQCRCPPDPCCNDCGQ